MPPGEKVPAAQLVQTVAPFAGETLPGAQGAQGAVAFCALLAEPAAQRVHALAFPAAQLPAGQPPQVAEPLGAAVPGAHAEHAVAFWVGAKEPPGQAVQLAAPDPANVPAPQP